MTDVSASPSAVTFAQLLGEGPMARVALEESLAAISSPAFISSESGTIIHANAPGSATAAAAVDGLRGELARAARSLEDPSAAAGALVTALRCAGMPTYYLVVFRAPSSLEARVEQAAQLWDLTPRQREVLALVAEGFANKTIAIKLRCAERTVESHLTAIFDKSGINGRTALVAAMAQR